jgi:hypothetical protein
MITILVVLWIVGTGGRPLLWLAAFVLASGPRG